MSTKDQPGRFNCYAAAFPDETIFTLLARDPALPATVEFWVAERIRLGKNETEDDKDRLGAALEEARSAAEWRETNLDPFGDGVPTWRVKMSFNDETSRPIRMEAARNPWGVQEAMAFLREIVQGIACKLPPEQIDAAQQRALAMIDNIISSVDKIEPITITRFLDGTCEPGDPIPFSASKIVTGPEFDDDDTYAIINEHGKGPVAAILSGMVVGGTREAAYAQALRLTQLLNSGVLRNEAVAAAAPVEESDLAPGYGEAKTISVTAISELLDYATLYGDWDENTPDGATHQNSLEPMHMGRRAAIVAYKKVLGLLPMDFITNPALRDLERDPNEGVEKVLLDPSEGMEKVLLDTNPADLAHSPEVPPHRFTMFHKGERYAYARGLEINPSHLPTALDAMALDGWHLLAIFGQTDSKHIGFIFERRPAADLLQQYRTAFPGMAMPWRGHRAFPVPVIPEDMDAEVEIHITATREAHADDLKGWLFSRLCGNSAQWPVKARVTCLIDGRPERAFDISVQPDHNCSEYGRGLEP